MTQRPKSNATWIVSLLRSRATSSGAVLIHIFLILTAPTSLGSSQMQTIDCSESNVSESDIVDCWIEEGRDQRDGHSYEEALLAFDKALQIDPNSSAAWMGKGDVLARLGMANQSLEACQMAIQLDPENAEAWFYKGNALYAQAISSGFNVSIFQEALTAYDQSIHLNGEYVRPWWGKSRTKNLIATTQTGEKRIETVEEALYDVQKATEMDPGFVDGWIYLGILQDNLATFSGNMSLYNLSIQSFDRAMLEAKPEDRRNQALAWEGRGLAFAHMGNALYDAGRYAEATAVWEEALDQYDQAMELDPDFTGLEARINKANVLALMGRYEERAESYTQALKSVDLTLEQANSSQELSQAWTQKGLLLHELGRYEEAVSALANATEADPQNQMAWKMQGAILTSDLGRHDDSLLAYEKALEMSPEDSELWSLKAEALLRKEEYDQALEAAAKGISLDPTSAYSWTVKGQALAALEDDEQSMQAFQEAIRLDPNMTASWLGLGDLFMKSERYEEALQAYQQAIVVAPAYQMLPKAWLGKGLALEALERPDEAVQAYQESVRLFDLQQNRDPRSADDKWEPGRARAVEALATHSGETA